MQNNLGGVLKYIYELKTNKNLFFWCIVNCTGGFWGIITVRSSSFSDPGKFCNRLLTEIPISHSLTEFNQPFNR